MVAPLPPQRQAQGVLAPNPAEENASTFSSAKVKGLGLISPALIGLLYHVSARINPEASARID